MAGHLRFSRPYQWHSRANGRGHRPAIFPDVHKAGGLPGHGLLLWVRGFWNGQRLGRLHGRLGLRGQGIVWRRGRSAQRGCHGGRGVFSRLRSYLRPETRNRALPFCNLRVLVWFLLPPVRQGSSPNNGRGHVDGRALIVAFLLDLPLVLPGATPLLACLQPAVILSGGHLTTRLIPHTSCKPVRAPVVIGRGPAVHLRKTSPPLLIG